MNSTNNLHEKRSSFRHLTENGRTDGRTDGRIDGRIYDKPFVASDNSPWPAGCPLFLKGHRLYIGKVYIVEAIVETMGCATKKIPLTLSQ